MRRQLVSVLAASLVTCGAGFAEPLVHYVFTTIDDPAFDILNRDRTEAFGVNDRGEVVGRFGTRAFLYIRGTFQPIQYPGADATRAFGINSHGEIVGSFDDGTGTHGFIYRRGVFAAFNVPGALVNGRAATHAHAINSSGEIVGDFDMSVGTGAITQGFRYSNGIFTTINVPGAYSTQAFGINDHGDVVGAASFPGVGGASGYILAKGTFHQLDHPDASVSASGGSVLTSATAINNRGQVVGFFTDAGAYRGFVYYDGTFTPLGAPPNSVAPVIPFGINDAGRIAGTFNSSTGNHGFFAVPIRRP